MIDRSKVLKTSCGCHIYLGAPNGDGYCGVTNAEGKSEGAHRVAWKEKKGPIPPGLCVLHKCDVPPCIKIGHLFLGTRGDNNRDRARKGRTVAPDHTGLKRSIETRRRQSESRKAWFAANPGKHPMLGRTVPAAQRLAQAAKLRGKKASEETRRKMSLSAERAWAQRRKSS